MDGYIDRLFRRLLLAGVPLFPGCFASSSCPDNASPIERTIEIQNPATIGDAGFSQITAAAYQRCVDTLDCTELCRQALPFANVLECQRVPTDGFASGDESVALQARYISICEGRRPEGHGADPLPALARCQVGDWLARAAYLEGVSVPAFRRLARELGAHGAPAALVRRARRAAGEEVRHHRMMTGLARRRGAVPAALPARFPSEIRPLPRVAIENAVEGCVRETLGAAFAAHQGQQARDPAIRACLRVIARDEVAHAELAFGVDAWTRGRLSPAARRQAREASLAALDTIDRETRAAETPPALAREAGLPAPAVAARIAAGVRETILSLS